MVPVTVEISKEEFQSLSELSWTYFSNGVVYDNYSDDVIAFEKNNSFWKYI
jgi:hypothetical protein